jgi:multidrug efflux system outer membrane protein
MAVQGEALIDYRKTIYSALRDVSDALINHDRTREQRGQEEKLVGALTETVRVANMRYQRGLDSYLRVLEAQRDLFPGQLILSQLRRQQVLSVVELYRALGGRRAVDELRRDKRATGQRNWPGRRDTSNVFL